MKHFYMLIKMTSFCCYTYVFVCSRMLWMSEKPDTKLSSLVSQLETA